MEVRQRRSPGRDVGEAKGEAEMEVRQREKAKPEARQRCEPETALR